MARTVSGGDELGQKRMNIVSVGIDAIPDSDNTSEAHKSHEVKQVEETNWSQAPSRTTGYGHRAGEDEMTRK